MLCNLIFKYANDVVYHFEESAFIIMIRQGCSLRHLFLFSQELRETDGFKQLYRVTVSIVVIPFLMCFFSGAGVKFFLQNGICLLLRFDGAFKKNVKLY